MPSDFVKLNEPRVRTILDLMGQIGRSARELNATPEAFVNLIAPIRYLVVADEFIVVEADDMEPEAPDMEVVNLIMAMEGLSLAHRMRLLSATVDSVSRATTGTIS